MLERLLKEFIFDPQGAKFVSLSLNAHDDSDADIKTTRQGWLIPGTGKQSARIYLGSDDDLLSVPAGMQTDDLDFVALCRKRYGASTMPDTGNHPVYGPANDFEAIPDLINAAWLHSLGDDKPASEALERAREAAPTPGEQSVIQPAANPDAAMIAGVQEKLAGFDYQRVIRDFMLRADPNAIAPPGDSADRPDYTDEPEAQAKDGGHVHHRNSFASASGLWPLSDFLRSALDKIFPADRKELSTCAAEPARR